MTTSNSYDFAQTVTRNDIIKDAYQTIGVIDPTEPLDVELAEQAAFKLNVLLRGFMAKGMNIWRREEATLFLETGKTTYQLGVAGDRCTGEINAVKNTDGITAIATAAAASATAINVTSTAGMAVGDSIGFKLDSGALYWDTIATVVDSDDLTITTGLSGAAAVGKTVYHYTNKIQRPLRIQSIMRRCEGIDTPITLISEQEYQNLSNKGTQGATNLAYYDPRRDTAGELHLWVPAATANEQIFFSYQRPFQDFDAPNDTADIPEEWLESLILALAYRLSANHVIPIKDRAVLRQDRDAAMDDAMGSDSENASLFIGADMAG